MNIDVTEKQKKLIEDIEIECGYEFKGKTKDEAIIFISNHIAEFKVKRENDTYAQVGCLND